MTDKKMKNYTIRSITLRNDVAQEVDKARGTIPRSTYINEILYKHLTSENMKKEIA
ncbi:MAG: hypothetical protein ACOC5T_08720 [Elusimicrobiota bacterium]